MRAFTSVPIPRPPTGWASAILQIAVLGVLPIGHASPQTGLPELQLSEVEAKNINAYAGMIRADLRKDKRAAIGDSVGLDPAVKDKFWAVYDRYEKEYKALWDVRLANTKKYADKYADSKEPMSDAAADSLAREFLKNDARMTELRSKYYTEFKAAVGARPAARFLHVESVFDRIIELQVLAIVPLAP
jgi:hypothetical protein